MSLKTRPRSPLSGEVEHALGPEMWKWTWSVPLGGWASVVSYTGAWPG